MYEVIPHFLYLTYTHNDGAAFSILTGKRIFLIIVGFLILFAIIAYLWKNKTQNKLEKLAYALLLGGSVGNLMDRLIRGYVIDFIDVKIFSYNYPIFNLADSFIVFGVLLLLITLYRKEKKTW